MATTVSPTDNLAQEIKQLTQQLLQAEESRIRPEDRRVAEIHEQLLQKERELRAQQEAEGQVIAEQERQRQLETLREIEEDERHVKAELDSLKVEQVRLPEKMFRLQFQHGQLLRLIAEMRKQLGV